MMDLHDRLNRIAGPAVPPTTAQADADLTRARRALNRRRAVQKLSVAAVAAVALAGAVTWVNAEGPAPAPAQVAATRLVAYQGEQPQGFTIDKVPAGWEIQGGSLGNLTIAPEGIADQSPDSFVGKIAIMLQSVDDTSTPTGTALEVGGKPAVLNEAGGVEFGKNLWVKQPDGVWMLVQIWDARGWTQADLAEFADGIHVEEGAQRGHG
ncbi:MAG: hypothetical protein ABW022_25690 [Actinoplanes sp.]